jgi:hypothetical protein
MDLPQLHLIFIMHRWPVNRQDQGFESDTPYCKEDSILEELALSKHRDWVPGTTKQMLLQGQELLKPG